MKKNPKKKLEDEKTAHAHMDRQDIVEITITKYDLQLQLNCHPKSNGILHRTIQMEVCVHTGAHKNIQYPEQS